MIINDLSNLSGAPQTTDELPIERGTTTYKVSYDTMMGYLIKPTTSGSFESIQAAAEGIWAGMDNARPKVGWFTRSGVGNYMYMAFKSSDNYAVLMCYTYGGQLRQIEKVNGTISEYTYARTAVT